MKAMKTLKMMAIASVMMAIFVQTSGAGEKSGEKPGWFRRMFSQLSWEEVTTVVETPKEICAVVRHNVKYQEDMGDEQQSGRETWEKRTGDCEDFAAVVIELSKTKSIEAAAYVIRPRDSAMAHVVVIGTHEGRMWMSSNGWYRSVDSVEDAKEAVAREMRWKAGELEVTPHQS